MLVLQSVQQRKLTSILINHKKLPAFSYVISPVFYTLFLQTSVRMANVLSSYRFVSVGFCCSGACQCALQFRRLTSHFCFVHQFLVFFLPFFSRQLSFRNVVENVYRLFLLSFSHFRLQILSSASVAQTNFYFDKSQKTASFFVCYQPCLLYTFSVDQCSYGKRPVFLPLCIRRFLLQWCLSVCTLVSPSYQPFLFRTLVFSFFPPLFFSATFISKRRGKCLPFIFTVIQPFSIANFKQCWVISPYFSRFPPFQNSHHTPFPLPSPKPLPVLPPPILPSARPRSTSTKFFVYFRSACTVNPLLFRSCLEVFFGSPLNVPVSSPLSWQKYA